MKQKYIFIGGPLNLQTVETDGYMYQDTMEKINPLKASKYVDVDTPDFQTSFGVHRYNLTDVYIMGIHRKFYVSEKLPAHEAQKRIGVFMASLIDLYIES